MAFSPVLKLPPKWRTEGTPGLWWSPGTSEALDLQRPPPSRELGLSSAPCRRVRRQVRLRGRSVPVGSGFRSPLFTDRPADVWSSRLPYSSSHSSVVSELGLRREGAFFQAPSHFSVHHLNHLFILNNIFYLLVPALLIFNKDFPNGKKNLSFAAIIGTYTLYVNIYF